MSAFGMQVACDCEGEPTGMIPGEVWDGDGFEGAFTEGRRYVWQCPLCMKSVCVNMQLVDEK